MQWPCGVPRPRCLRSGMGGGRSAMEKILSQNAMCGAEEMGVCRGPRCCECMPGGGAVPGMWSCEKHTTLGPTVSWMTDARCGRGGTHRQLFGLREGARIAECGAHRAVAEVILSFPCPPKATGRIVTKLAQGLALFVERGPMRAEGRPGPSTRSRHVMCPLDREVFGYRIAGAQSR